jgi:hypothetical protein
MEIIMKFKIFFAFITSTSVLLATGCGSGAPANVNTTNANSANTNITKANTNSPLTVTTPTPEQTTNNAPTLTPVYKAYCTAMEKNDEAALRKLYSQDTIKHLEEQMKEEGVKTLTKFLEDEKVTSQLCEVRNEKINGDTAVAEIIAAPYPKGNKVVFVKENGEWKLTNREPDFDAKKAAQPASNTGK